jgi:uncharacterized membrane protein YfcA
MNPVLFIALGVLVGSLAGLFGVAGGVFLVPALAIWFGFSQKNAQGTTLAMLLLPIGIGAVYQYYRHGHVNVKAALLIAVGFVVGGFIGASVSVNLPNVVLTRLFGLLSLGVAIKFLFFS